MAGDYAPSLENEIAMVLTFDRPEPARSLAALRSICPRCKRRRFIPHAWAPYCTRSCEREAASQVAAGKEG